MIVEPRLARTISEALHGLLHVERKEKNLPIHEAIEALCENLVKVSDIGQGKHGTTSHSWDAKSSVDHYNHLASHSNMAGIAASARNEGEPAWLRTEEESGLPHSAHAVLRALMMAVRDEMEERGQK